MKKSLEEEIATRNSYVTIVEIRVADFTTMTSFWPQVLEIIRETYIREIWSKVDEVREVTEWECPVDRTNIQVLC
jgi:hypothetical protein